MRSSLSAIFLMAVLTVPQWLAPLPLDAQSSEAADRSADRQLYVAACANCHAGDGTGAARSQVGFAEALPDFTDCSFASREAAQDWYAIVHQGGPVRGFSKRMPAFGKALTSAQIERVVAYVRTLCHDASWPRGELNLPRAMETEKAFPEDEVVLTSSAVREAGQRSASATLTYEKRFGARNQYEVSIPFGVRELQGNAGTQWSSGQLGDIKIALKRVVAHNGEAGHILSLGGEVALPTGDAGRGFGAGTTIFEPFVLGAQTIGANGFVQFQVGAELPVNTEKAARDAFARVALGNSFQPFRFGRTWTPMVEFIVGRELGAESGTSTEWDILPSMEVSLNKRQHLQLSLGMRLPMTAKAGRPKEFLAYFVWDWFDGGLRDGW